MILGRFAKWESKKLLLTISMNLSQKKIQAMISHQHQNVDVAVDAVAEEEECINIKQTSHPKESNLKLYRHALYHVPQAPPTGQQAQNVPQCSVPPNQPQAQAPPTAPQSAPVPPVFPIPDNVPLAVGQSGQHSNAQLLYGPLVPQNDDHLLCGRQQTIAMI